MRLGILLLAGMAAWGCGCDALPSAVNGWARSEKVFVGRVESVSEGRIVLRVGEGFKGTSAGEQVVLDHRSNGCIRVSVDTPAAVMYVTNGELEMCGRSRTLDRAADDLKFLRKGWTSLETNRLSGVVRERDKPVAGVVVHSLCAVSSRRSIGRR